MIVFEGVSATQGGLLLIQLVVGSIPTRPTIFEKIHYKSIREVRSVARARPSTLNPQTGFPRSSARRLNAPVFKIVVDHALGSNPSLAKSQSFLLPSCRAHFPAVYFIDQREEHGKSRIYI